MSSSGGVLDRVQARPHEDRRPVLIGMNNPVSVDPAHALYPLPKGRAGHRLYEMLAEVNPSVTMSSYARTFERLNLVIGPFDRAVARERAAELIPVLAGRGVVLLGKEVARAFYVVDEIDWIPRRVHGATFYLLPHPSGRNHKYNDPDVRRAAGEVLARLYAEARE